MCQSSLIVVSCGRAAKGPGIMAACGRFSMVGATSMIYSLELRQLNDRLGNSANGRCLRFVINAVLRAVEEAQGGRRDSARSGRTEARDTPR